MHVGVYLDDMDPREGGGFTFVHDILSAFLSLADSSPHRFTLFCGASVESQIQTKLPANVATAIIAPRGFFATVVAELRHVSPAFAIFWTRPSTLERLARRLNIDLLWFIGGAYDTPNIPFVTTVWDLQHRTHPWLPEVSAKGVWEHREAFFARHLRRAAHIITGTTIGREQLALFYGIPSERVSILPHPTPRFALDNPPTGKLPFGVPSDFLFYPAQLWAHKNHANLLRAYAILAGRRRDVPELVFSGSDKGVRRALDQLIRQLGLTNRVHFLGFVSVDEIIALYRQARALVYPSISGPENLPPLEAFALRCPVIASEIIGAREQLGDAALYFDPLNPDSIASAIEIFLKDPMLREQLVERGAERATRWTAVDFVHGVFEIVHQYSAHTL